jgi:hypothetical protein
MVVQLVVALWEQLQALTAQVEQQLKVLLVVLQVMAIMVVVAGVELVKSITAGAVEARERLELTVQIPKVVTAE